MHCRQKFVSETKHWSGHGLSGLNASTSLDIGSKFKARTMKRLAPPFSTTIELRHYFSWVLQCCSWGRERNVDFVRLTEDPWELTSLHALHLLHPIQFSSSSISSSYSIPQAPQVSVQFLVILHTLLLYLLVSCLSRFSSAMFVIFNDGL